MHSPSARALRALDRYCIILVHTLKHLLPAKCDINNITWTLFTNLKRDGGLPLDIAGVA